MRKQLTLGLATLSVAVAGTIGLAQIKALTLNEMVDVADGAIHGQIVGSDVFRIDDPVDGPELFYTTIRIEGRSLMSGDLTTVDVTYHGGFVSDTEGVYNSEAPSKDDTESGSPVVVFYKWQDNMGGGVSANALVASHGGLFRTIGSGSVETVLGRGEGYAVNNNIRLTDLESAVAKLHQAKIGRSENR